MKKILIVTERRADFSRFKPIIDLIEKDNELDYFLIVTGAHLSKKFGKTINEIKSSKIKIFKSFSMFDQDYEKNDTGSGMTIAMGKAFINLSKILSDLKVDIILSGFDIAANFAVTVIGAHMNIPVAHIQGGEVSGTIDESIRHGMSKFSHYHLTANNDSKRRLIKMGELKKNIYTVGCPSIDAILNEQELSAEYVLKKIKIDINKKYILILQHPVTSETELIFYQINETIKALKSYGLQKLVIFPNNDAGASRIIKKIKSSNINHVSTLTLPEYKTLLKYCSVLVGNSSSGIHEALSFQKPVVNIGTRQNGRLKPKNIIDVKHNSLAIKKAIDKSLYDKNFLAKIKKLKNPYGDGNSALRIISILKKLNLDKNKLQKQITY